MEIGIKRLPNEMKYEINYFLLKLESRTKPRVPYRKGKLVGSAKRTVKTSNQVIEGELKYSAKSDRGYDYAEIQHRRCDFQHPIRGECRYLAGALDFVRADWPNHAERALRRSFNI